jgi:hypothetical protein
VKKNKSGDQCRDYTLMFRPVPIVGSSLGHGTRHYQEIITAPYGARRMADTKGKRKHEGCVWDSERMITKRTIGSLIKANDLLTEAAQHAKYAANEQDLEKISDVQEGIALTISSLMFHVDEEWWDKNWRCSDRYPSCVSAAKAFYRLPRGK